MSHASSEISLEKLEHVRRLRVVAMQAATSLLAGQYRSIFRGRGMEFDEVREYQVGDEVRDIDWNVTARTGDAHIKRYVEERLISVFILVDLSASQRIRSDATEDNKQTAAQWVAAMLAAIAGGGGDLSGLLLFTDEIELFLPPSRGPQHLDRLIRELLYHETQGTGTDIAKAVQSLHLLGKQRSILFLISDFQDESFHHDLKLCALEHDVVAVRIRDNAEQRFPKAGLVQLQDAETGKQMLVDSSSPVVREKWQEVAVQTRREFEDFCRKSKIDLLDITAGEDYAKALNIFFQKRMMKF